MLGAGEFAAAVDDDDVVLLGQRHRILYRRVAGADDDDGLVHILLGIVELILDEVLVGAGHAHLAEIPLQAYGQHHVVGGDRVLVGKADIEGAVLQADSGDLRIQAQIDAETGDSLIPSLQDALAGTGLEGEGTAKRQQVGRRHHELALLILEDGVGAMRRALEEDVGNIVFRRAGAGAEPAWTRPDHGNFEMFSHGAPPLRLACPFLRGTVSPLGVQRAL